MMKLFALHASRAYGATVAEALGVPLASHEERDFEDSEFKVRPLESVRGQHVFVIQSLYGDAAQSSNDKLCRLLFFVGGLKDAGAAEVTAVVPYLAYMRKDRRTKARDPITTRYVAAIFESVGLDTIVTLDVHNIAAFENAFRCRKEHIEAAALMIEHFDKRIGAGVPVVVMSPDAGGVKRARAFADLFAQSSGRAVELAFMEKQRSEGRVSGTAFAGEVRGAAVIIVDDLVATGTTIVRAAHASRERGAVEVHAAVTHGIFAPGAAQTLASADLASVVATDTIGNVRERCPTLAGKLVVLETATLVAQSIRRLAG
jgi:ribose-phosphate pyrophosphokinase